MTPQVFIDDVKDACFVLEYVVHDLIAAHQLYDIFKDISKVAVTHSETEKAVRRMYIAFIILSLNKFAEFYDKYKSLIPENCKARAKEIRKEVDRRQIRKLRNTFIGHVIDDKTGRPITNAEIDSAFNQATDGNVIAFLNWVHVSGETLSPETVVGLMQSIQSELAKTYAITSA